MNIKLLLSSFSFFVFIYAFPCCKEDDSDLAPIDQLPPLTTTGENTFGCLVNGEVFVTKSKTKVGAIIQGGGLQLFGTVENQQVDKAISIRLIEIPEIKSYILNNTMPARAEYRDQVVNCNYETNEIIVGIINITFFDTANYIISGTFEFTATLNALDSDGDCANTVNITDGRFDIKYIP